MTTINRLVKVYLVTLILIFSIVNVYGFDSEKFIEIMKSRRETPSKSFNNNHSILFFYSSKCSYCHKFAPILKEYQLDNDLDIIPVSHDGNNIPGFTNSIYDPVLFSKFNIQSYPTVIAVNKYNGRFYTISIGYTNYSELEYNFKNVIASSQGGHMS